MKIYLFLVIATGIAFCKGSSNNTRKSPLRSSYSLKERFKRSLQMSEPENQREKRELQVNFADLIPKATSIEVRSN